MGQLHGTDWYIPDEDEEFYASVSVASGSDADPGGTVPATADFQAALLFILGIICGVLLVGKRRFL